MDAWTMTRISHNREFRGNSYHRRWSSISLEIYPPNPIQQLLGLCVPNWSKLNFNNFNWISQFQQNFTISTEFHNFNCISQHLLIFTILTDLHNFDWFSQFWLIFTISTGSVPVNSPPLPPSQLVPSNSTATFWTFLGKYSVHILQTDSGSDNPSAPGPVTNCLCIS